MVKIRLYSNLLPRSNAPGLEASGSKESRCHILDISIQQNSDQDDYDVKTLKVRGKDEWNCLMEENGEEKWVDFDTYPDYCINYLGYRSTSAFRETVGVNGYAAFFDWYKASGRPFRFMDLPLEIRLNIYAHSIGRDIYPKRGIWPSLGPNMCLGKGWTPTPPPIPEFIYADTHDPKDVIDAQFGTCISQQKYSYGSIRLRLEIGSPEFLTHG
jgi:hypothetical protein